MTNILRRGTKNHLVTNKSEENTKDENTKKKFRKKKRKGQNTT